MIITVAGRWTATPRPSDGTAAGSSVPPVGVADERQAVLTAQELECWLALAVACYRPGARHTRRTPVGVWAEKVAEAGPPVMVNVEAAFLEALLYNGES